MLRWGWLGGVGWKGVGKARNKRAGAHAFARPLIFNTSTRRGVRVRFLRNYPALADAAYNIRNKPVPCARARARLVTIVTTQASY